MCVCVCIALSVEFLGGQLACGGAMMQLGVYGQTLPIDGKMRRRGWAKLLRKEVILCGNFPLSCQHVSQDQGKTERLHSDMGGSSKKECLECLDESVPALTATTRAVLKQQ